MIEAKTAVPDRALKDSTHTASVTFYEDGAIGDPGVVTIQIDREDGTNLVAAGSATSGTGAAARTFALTTTHTALLDTLKLTWTSPTKGVLVTYVEVVGGFLFSLDYARKLKPLDDATKYPVADLVAARTLAETALEEACGVAFVPRYRREKVDGSGAGDVLLAARPLTIRSASVGGVALTAGELADLEVYRDGRLYNPLGWTAGRKNVEVVYERGYEFPPPRVAFGARALTRHFLVESAIPERATGWTTPEGASQWLMTAGVRDAVFSLPEAQIIVDLYGVRGGEMVS